MDFRTAADFGKVTQAIEKLTSKGYNQDDDTFWKPEVDKTGNGYAVVRFLPTPECDGEDGVPIVKLFSYNFQNPDTGLWYIENSPITLDPKAFDPVAEANRKAWNEGESGKKIARSRAMRRQYIANVYIVEDSENPENEGKVKRWRFGKKIFDMVEAAFKPKFKDETPINPFDLINGANFKIKIRTVDSDGNEFLNYDKSEFGNPAPLFKSEDKLMEIWQQAHSLKELVSPEKFKSSEELKERFAIVMGEDYESPMEKAGKDATASLRKSTAEKIDDDIPFERPKASNDEDEEVDKDLEYFKNLAKGAA